MFKLFILIVVFIFVVISFNVVVNCDLGEIVIKFSYVINIDKYLKGIVVLLLEKCVNEEMNGKVCM